MARFSRSDQLRLRDLTGELATVRTNGPPALESFLPQLRELLALDRALVYSVRQEECSLSRDMIATDGMALHRQMCIDEMDAMIRGAPRQWGVFNPLRPEAPQRNRAMATPPIGSLLAGLEQQCEQRRYGMVGHEEGRAAINGLNHSLATFSRLGVAKDWQLRVL